LVSIEVQAPLRIVSAFGERHKNYTRGLGTRQKGSRQGFPASAGQARLTISRCWVESGKLQQQYNDDHEDDHEHDDDDCRVGNEETRAVKGA